MADEDIFKLTFEPNTDEVEQALIEMGKNVDRLVDIGLKGMEGSFQRQIADIAKMNVMLDPAVLKERVRLDREQAELAERYKKAYDEAAEIFPTAELPFASLAPDAESPLQSVYEKLEKLQKSLDPDILKEEARLRKEIAEAEEKRAEAFEKYNKDNSAPEILTALSVQEEFLKEATEELKKHAEQMEKIKVLSDPSLIKQQVENERELAELTRQQALARAKMEESPEQLKQRISDELELEDIKKRIIESENAERLRQRPVEEEPEKRESPAERRERTATERAGMLRSVLEDPSKVLVGLFVKLMGVISGKTLHKAEGGDVEGPEGTDQTPAMLTKGEFVVNANDADKNREVLEAMNKGRVAHLAAGGTVGGGGSNLGTMGAMAGEAIGGPVGAVIGEKLAEAIPGTIAAPVKMMSDSFQALGSSLGELNSVLGPVGVGFNVVSGAMEGVGGAIKSIPLVGEVLGPMVDQFVRLPGILKDATATLVGFAAVASPSQFKRFQMAIEDVQGVIGQAFLPVLNMMRDGIKMFGDVLATILPNTNEVYDALGDLRGTFSEFGKTLTEFFVEFGPMIKEFFIGSLQLLAAAMSSVIKVIQSLIQWLSPLLKTLRDFFGIAANSKKELESGTGAAARQVQISGFEQYQQEVQKRAFAEPGRPTAEDLPKTVSNIEKYIASVAKWAESFTLTALGEQILKAIKDSLPDPAGTAAAAASTAGSTIKTASGLGLAEAAAKAIVDYYRGR